MSKIKLSEQLKKESEIMMKITAPAISYLMKHKALTVQNVELVNLHTAAKYGFCEIMQMFLTTGGSNINILDPGTGNTAFHIAVNSGQLEMVKLLVKSGAKITKNKEKQTPVDLAQDQHPDIYKYLCSLEKLEHKEVELAGED